MSFSFVLAWMGFVVARNKEACPSHTRVLESDRIPAFLLLLLLLLLLLASAAGASAAAAAAAAVVLLVGPAQCFFFFFQLSCESCTSMMHVVRTLRKVPGTNTNDI